MEKMFIPKIYLKKNFKKIISKQDKEIQKELSSLSYSNKILLKDVINKKLFEKEYSITIPLNSFVGNTDIEIYISDKYDKMYFVYPDAIHEMNELLFVFNFVDDFTFDGNLMFYKDMKDILTLIIQYQRDVLVKKQLLSQNENISLEEKEKLEKETDLVENLTDIQIIELVDNASYKNNLYLDYYKFYKKKVAKDIELLVEDTKQNPNLTDIEKNEILRLYVKES